jgi:hypothetical protein
MQSGFGIKTMPRNQKKAKESKKRKTVLTENELCIQSLTVLM